MTLETIPTDCRKEIRAYEPLKARPLALPKVATIDDHVKHAYLRAKALLEAAQYTLATSLVSKSFGKAFAKSLLTPYKKEFFALLEKNCTEKFVQEAINDQNPIMVARILTVAKDTKHLLNRTKLLQQLCEKKETPALCKIAAILIQDGANPHYKSTSEDDSAHDIAVSRSNHDLIALFARSVLSK